MSKNPNLPGAEDKPTERNLSDILSDDAPEWVPEDWEKIGENAARYEREERPRREQMNLDIADDVKREFKEHIREDRLQMRFVVEDLLRIYLDGLDR
jgi:hypothetical protein